MNERLIIPTNLVSSYSKHPLIKTIYSTAAGYFSSASHHYRDRNKGCTEYSLLYCMNGKGIITLQVQEIAQKLGYNDVCYFSRAFKQSRGMSPRTYRNLREPVGIFKNLKPNI